MFNGIGIAKQAQWEHLKSRPLSLSKLYKVSQKIKLHEQPSLFVFKRVMLHLKTVKARDSERSGKTETTCQGVVELGILDGCPL